MACLNNRKITNIMGETHVIGPINTEGRYWHGAAGSNRRFPREAAAYIQERGHPAILDGIPRDYLPVGF